MFQRRRLRSRGVDDCPVDGADIIALLKLGNLGRGVGCVGCAPSDPALPRCKIGREEDACKGDLGAACGVSDGGALCLARRHRIHHDGMPLGKNRFRPPPQRVIDPFGYLGPIRVRLQPLGLPDAEELLSQHITAQDDGARLRCDKWRQRARHDRLSGAGQPADGNENGGRRVEQSARKPAAWIDGPSAIGSVKGMPSSIMSAPAFGSALMMSSEVFGSGSPAIM